MNKLREKMYYILFTSSQEECSYIIYSSRERAERAWNIKQKKYKELYGDKYYFHLKCRIFEVKEGEAFDAGATEFSDVFLSDED